ncbi:flagellar hook-basal body complex protein FliE [Thalassococcus sp. CAU 1522]|uniref:Flagellar hook-basal body complex protein FliE n=1 Tax=Thalassococcus arenae TaxID=2851652 RepID=A0ABS6N5P1_9RHOB|nr:flagellar hook-basal body complex protein FliE [Thalassococcus arenae]MBV2359333.1 flagellar hook-basal body complex protein FliE [Thalassococcus arenae]
MDVRSLFATQKYAASRPAMLPDPGSAPKPETTGAASAIADFAATLREAETTAKAAMTGGADPHALVEALAQSELAVETVVALRNKVVEAYQEILRMPV